MKGVARALQILELVADRGPIGVSDIARILEIPKSTAQRNLVALAESGWIRPVGQEYKRWTLTPRALVVGHRGSSEGTIAEAAKEHLVKLRDLVDETVTLQVRTGMLETVHIDSAESTQPVRAVISLGLVSYITVTSGGLSMLSHLPEREVDEILSHPIPRSTAVTVTDPEEVRRMLPEIRERGYAINQGQNRVGISAVGTAIVDASGAPMAAIGISVPEGRFTEDRIPILGGQVVDAANAIAAKLW